MTAPPIEDIRLPNGVMVRIRAPRPGDGPAIDRLLADPDAIRAGRSPGPGDRALVAEQPWSGEIVGHAAWRRLSGARAAAGAVVTHELARTPLAAHLLVRLARLADEALLPVLALGPLDAEAPSVLFVRAVFDAQQQTAELRTEDWQEAMARVSRIAEVPPVEPFAHPRAEPARAPAPARHGVVIVGGGVAALECLMALRDLVGPDVPIRLVAPDDDFVYRPLQVAEPFGGGDARRYPLAGIAADFGADLVPRAAVAVRPDARELVVDDGSPVPYDALVLAPGARPARALPGAVTLGDPGAPEAIRSVAAGLRTGELRDVAFAAPRGITWTLPLYELALMTRRSAGATAARLTIVTPEPAALAVFGPPVSARVSELLDAAGIEFVGSAYASMTGTGLRIDPGGRELPAARVVALPALHGPALAGVPADAAGFIRVGRDGRVEGLRDVYAAGDATTFPVKQGGLAAQQADAVAEAVAAGLGAAVTSRPFKPVLRGLLFTGGETDTFLRADIGGGEGDATAGSAALWWPPAKVAGLYLAPYLLRRDNGAAVHAPPGFTPVAVALHA